MTSKEVIKRLKEDGWIEVIPRTPGSHRHFRHPTKPGKTAGLKKGYKSCYLFEGNKKAIPNNLEIAFIMFIHIYW